MSGISLPVGDAWVKADEDQLNIIHDCYCPNCQGTKAITRMLPTKVPLFRELIVMALDCPECHFRNSEISFGGEIQEKGVRYTLDVTGAEDMNRQLVKSDSASLMIPVLDIEVPPNTQKGTISTVEGFLKRIAENLEELQPERLKLGDLDNFHRCHEVIEKIKKITGNDEGDEDDQSEDNSEILTQFKIILDDPAGNSFVENPYVPKSDPNLIKESYIRTATQDMSLGLQPSQQARKDGTIDDQNPLHKNVASGAKRDVHNIEHFEKEKEKERKQNVGRREALSFPTPCPNCTKPCETKMCVTDIPHFKEVIIMSLMCDSCGYKSNEVKGGGGIPAFGTKCTVIINTAEDMGREVLKSDTAGVAIPELELELDEGSLNGMYTTVEGLMQKLYDNLVEANPFGDSKAKHHLNNDGCEFSGPTPTQVKYQQFLDKLKACGKGQMLPFSLVIDDPLSNSFIGPVPKDALALALQAEEENSNACFENYVDDFLTIEEYTRSADQDEILGIADMKTEFYVGQQEQYGTDAFEDLPDRLKCPVQRGPDHPHEVGKAPVEGDTTVMGKGSTQFAIPSIGKRGDRTIDEEASVDHSKIGQKSFVEELEELETNDTNFLFQKSFDGLKEGMVYKCGKKGLGYYTDFLIKK